MKDQPVGYLSTLWRRGVYHIGKSVLKSQSTLGSQVVSEKRVCFSIYLLPNEKQSVCAVWNAEFLYHWRWSEQEKFVKLRKVTWICSKSMGLRSALSASSLFTLSSSDSRACFSLCRVWSSTWWFRTACRAASKSAWRRTVSLWWRSTSSWSSTCSFLCTSCCFSKRLFSVILLPICQHYNSLGHQNTESDTKVRPTERER